MVVSGKPLKTGPPIEWNFSNMQTIVELAKKIQCNTQISPTEKLFGWSTFEMLPITETTSTPHRTWNLTCQKLVCCSLLKCYQVQPWLLLPVKAVKRRSKPVKAHIAQAGDCIKKKTIHRQIFAHGPLLICYHLSSKDAIHFSYQNTYYSGIECQPSNTAQNEIPTLNVL